MSTPEVEANIRNGGFDLESQEFDSFSKSIRHGFIRRVYMLISLQVLFDLAMSFMVLYIPQLRLFVSKNLQVIHILAFVSALISSLLLFVLYNYSNTLQSHSSKMALFCLVTISEAVLLSLLSLMVRTKYLLMALSITSVVVISLTVFSFQTKYDFTSYHSFIFFGTIAFSVFSFIYMFFPTVRIIELIVSPLAVLFFSFGLVYATQSVIGEGKYMIYEDDYVLAALLIHSYIIDIFIHILRFIVALNSNK
ncbi:transmembrane domain-containing protein [Cryptosporidium canis]|uniref:Transmembrane domain-containing protein n=1 Tax=Cryptosporidium canis TaxID=195482 RepID=A0A9D5DHN6_9CRYT|nr:transmembrane domain-containing protein [Cryptosporidium canis]